MINIYIESGVNQAKRKSKETTNEQDFLVNFIQHHFPGKVRGLDFQVIGFGGKDTLANNATILADSIIQGNENIVIFDADTPYNQGGYQKRKSEIYTYIELMRKSPLQQDAFKRGYWLFNNPSFWNLDAKAGYPLYEFLKAFLG